MLEPRLHEPKQSFGPFVFVFENEKENVNDTGAKTPNRLFFWQAIAFQAQKGRIVRRLNGYKHFVTQRLHFPHAMRKKFCILRAQREEKFWISRAQREEKFCICARSAKKKLTICARSAKKNFAFCARSAKKNFMFCAPQCEEKLS